MVEDDARGARREHVEVNSLTVTRVLVEGSRCRPCRLRRPGLGSLCGAFTCRKWRDPDLVFLFLVSCVSLGGVPQAGLVESLDKIAAEFVEAADKAAELAKAEGLVKALEGAEAK